MKYFGWKLLVRYTEIKRIKRIDISNHLKGKKIIISNPTLGRYLKELIKKDILKEASTLKKVMINNEEYSIPIKTYKLNNNIKKIED